MMTLLVLCLLSPLLAWAQVCPPGSAPSMGLSPESQMTMCPGANGTVWVEGRLGSKEPSARDAAIMAIVMDGQVLSSPTIKAAIRKRAIITGKFTEQEIRSMVIALQKGMPAQKPVPYSEINP